MVIITVTVVFVVVLVILVLVILVGSFLSRSFRFKSSFSVVVLDRCFVFDLFVSFSLVVVVVVVFIQSHPRINIAKPWRANERERESVCRKET